jgi:hypothetical protein
MGLIVAIAILACLALGMAPVFAIRRASAAKLPLTADWIDDLSVERYRPMLRLLDDTELRLLCSRTGVAPDLVAQLRRQRVAIFRGYLRSLRSDFNRICAAMKVLLLQAGTDRPDLASLLIHSQIAFAWSLMLIHARLALYSCGIGTVDARNALKLFDGLRVELRALDAARMSASA